MKNIKLIIFLLIGSPTLGVAQMVVSGGYLRLASSGMINTENDVIVKGGATIDNAATLSCRNLSSEALSTVKGSGMYNIQGGLIAFGNISGAGTFAFRGSQPASIFSSGTQIPKMIISKVSPNAFVSLASSITIKNNLKFENTSSEHLLLGDYDLTFLPAANVTGFSNTRFIVTNGLGRYIRQNVSTSAKTYYIGATQTTYNPLTITNIGVLDTIGVRCLQNALENGGTGSPITANAVGASWEITEESLGNSNLSLTTKWYASDELSGFSRTSCSIRNYNGTSWDFSPLGAATGTGSPTNPYSRSRTGLTELGYFAVFDGDMLFAYSERNKNKQPEINYHQGYSIVVYPNPANDFIRVDLRSTLPLNPIIEMFDVQGRPIKCLFKGSVTSQYHQDFIWYNPNIPLGMYFIRVMINNEINTYPVFFDNKGGER